MRPLELYALRGVAIATSRLARDFLEWHAGRRPHNAPPSAAGEDPLSLLRRERCPSGICLLRGDMLPLLVLSIPVLHMVRMHDYTATAATRVAFLRKQAMVMSVSITSPNTA